MGAPECRRARRAYVRDWRGQQDATPPRDLAAQPIVYMHDEGPRACVQNVAGSVRPERRYPPRPAFQPRSARTSSNVEARARRPVRHRHIMRDGRSSSSLALPAVPGAGARCLPAARVGFSASRSDKSTAGMQSSSQKLSVESAGVGGKEQNRPSTFERSVKQTRVKAIHAGALARGRS